MKLINTLDTIPPEAQGSVLVIGNFDGLHLGHQAVIGVAGRIAREHHLKLAVLTFDPHPRRFFKPEENSLSLTPFAVRQRLLAILNVDYLFAQNFTKAFSLKPASQFIQEVLVDRLKAKHIVVGDQFQFGADRTGNITTLRSKADELGFQVTPARPSRDQGGNLYSSTRVRDYLSQGDVANARRILGRPWEVSGKVLRGEQKAGGFGYPTANLSLGDYFRPLYGVYAVRVGVGEGAYTEWHDGVANFGVRPTLDGKTELLEPHIFNFKGDLYGQDIRVQFIEFIRKEEFFGKISQLRDQIGQDAEKAREILAGK